MRRLELEIRQIVEKGASYEIKIYKGKASQTRKLQKCIIHPNVLQYLGDYCQVALLDSYMAACVDLGYASNSNYLFPSICGKFTKV